MGKREQSVYTEADLDALAEVLSDVQHVERWHQLLAGNAKVMERLRDSKDQFDYTGIGAVGFDANALIKIRINSNMQERVRDFFFENISQLICILPSQSMLEFWNNTVNAVSVASPNLDRSCSKLLDSLREAEGFFDPAALTMLEQLRDQAEAYKPEKMTEENQLFQRVFSEFSCFPAVPRNRFLDIFYRVRKEGGFPPGFKDQKKEINSAGDYLVWADFLLGCYCDARDFLSREEKKYVVFVSNDKKVDWLPNGYPHPLLLAEVDELLHKEMVIVDVDTFVSKVIPN